MPLCVGVPLSVITLDAQTAVTPAGNPVATPIPVAPLVVCKIFVNGVLIHIEGNEDAALTVLPRTTEMTPLADTSPQPPVNGIL